MPDTNAPTSDWRAVVRKRYLQIMKPEWLANIRSTLNNPKWYTPIEVVFGRDGYFVNVTYRHATVLDTFWADGDTCHHFFPGVGWLHNGCTKEA